MYRIDNFHHELCSPFRMDVHDFIKVRKANMKITTIKWIPWGVEIDPYYIDCTYILQFPILIFLN